MLSTALLLWIIAYMLLLLLLLMMMMMMMTMIQYIGATIGGLKALVPVIFYSWLMSCNNCFTAAAENL